MVNFIFQFLLACLPHMDGPVQGRSQEFTEGGAGYRRLL